MRTNIDIDDDLMAEAMRLAGTTTKRSTVEEALRELIRRHKIGELRALRGKVEWIGDLDEMRTDSDSDALSNR
ncbi:MAG TPA: type II toxin-antitoxin system VapB family antitoxin [Actinomycetales bacterium]|nr:type II toxin-antitoxin system VapB family antitoxin [Actinomycetales bacterium]